MSGTSIQKQRGIQVVKMSSEQGRRWDLDEKALASVLLREDIHNLPVVLVSIVGPYRVGKSFILDFFLRYLLASKEHQSKGQWLGKKDDILEGFHWRCGANSHTKGMYLWPEPIVVDIEPTGGKVAVLLMDTQGTFDTESDMGDNSTIFAMSILLSSNLIYNNRSNIQEDHLQHLQLFTAYGKMASTLEGKAFQTLLFLIRDWEHPNDHAFGYKGGKALLDSKLALKKKQKEELREVRQHIHSCFEKLECFLMPHPGPCVRDSNFKGCLSDMDKLFETYLLELVPTLFSQNNLTPKTINGEQVQAQELFEYFKHYVAIFNSDEMPPVSTIFQATADCTTKNARLEAGECYESMMMGQFIKGQSVLTSMIQTWHDAALKAAIAHFMGKKKIGSTKNQIKDNLRELKKTSNTLLGLYQYQNDAELRTALSKANKAYKDKVETVCTNPVNICLHGRDLEALHKTALIAALNSFDPTRTTVPPKLDTDRDDFIKKLEQSYKNLCLTNDRNNNNAALEARIKYVTNMSGKTKKVEHEYCLKIAIEHFLSHRNQPSKETGDDELDHLRQEIEEYYNDCQTANGQKNLEAMNAAEALYKNYMDSMRGSEPCYFHPLTLKKMHDEALERALAQFQKDRANTDEDDFKERLITKIKVRYQLLENSNRLNNIDAVDLAYDAYNSAMEKLVKDWYNVLRPESQFLTGIMHETQKNIAIKQFCTKRQGAVYDDDDMHLTSLKEKIDMVYVSKYEPLLETAARVVVIPVVNGVKYVGRKIISLFQS